MWNKIEIHDKWKINLSLHRENLAVYLYNCYYTPAPRRGRGYTVLPLSVCPSVLPSVQDIFCHIFLSNYQWQKYDIWSQASYRYAILWVAFLDPSDSYFLFTDLVGFYTHWTYMHIFHHIFLSNYWWHKSDIWSQASYRYPISWEAFFDSSDSYFLFADLVGFYTHLTYMHIFRRIFLSKYWWQESDVWSQASYRYVILWEAFLGPIYAHFLLHFSQQILMAEIWYFVTSFIYNVGTPFCGKRFLTRQIPTSCLPTWLVFLHIEHICGGIISEH